MQFLLLAFFVAGGAYLFSRDSKPSSDNVLDIASEAVKNTVANVNRIFPTKYDDLIDASAKAQSIDPDVLWRLLYQESRFREDIVTGRVTSPVGALGIAQFMPATAREWGVNPLDPASAIPGAARYLRWLINQFGGDLDKAVAAYNWGIGNVRRKGLAVAPNETVKYVAAITGTDISQA